MINDVTAAFGDWLETVTGVRKVVGYVNGRPVEGADEPFSFQAVVQNANPDDLKVLPEGNRTDETIKLHTTTALQAQTNTYNGDIITYHGDSYLVHNVANRRIGNYYKALAVRI